MQAICSIATLPLCQIGNPLSKKSALLPLCQREGHRRQKGRVQYEGRGAIALQREFAWGRYACSGGSPHRLILQLGRR